MDKYFTVRDQAHLLFELVESLNRGNSCSWDDRVAMAEKQLEQLDVVIKRLRERNLNDR
jgi:hypothetical protein